MSFWMPIGLLMPLVAALAFVERCDWALRGGPAGLCLRAVLTLVFALSASSASFLISLVLGLAPGRSYCLVETLVFALFALIFRLAPRRGIPESNSTANVSHNASGYGKLLCAVFFISLAFAALGLLGTFAVEPHGGWDAWNMWNMKARYVYRSGEAWRNAFGPSLPQPDYPVLVSLTIARCWTYLGRETMAVPHAIALVFTLAGAGILTAAVARLRGAAQGWLAGLGLLGTVFYLQHGASLYVDVPLSLYYLAALALLAMHDASRRSSAGLLVLAGFAAASAAWTKNEGLLFLCSVVLVRTLVAWRRGCAGDVIRELGPLLAGAAPVLVAIIIFKVSVAAKNDILSAQDWHTSLARLTDRSRALLIARISREELWHVGKVLPIILVLAWALLGGARDRPRGVVWPVTAVLALVLAGYFCIYMLTPIDLEFQLLTSAGRLIVQLWPSMLLAAFVYLSDPTARSPDAAA